MSCQVMVPTDERPQEGQMALSVELTALCSPDARPGRYSEVAHCLNEQACQTPVLIPACALC